MMIFLVIWFTQSQEQNPFCSRESAVALLDTVFPRFLLSYLDSEVTVWFKIGNRLKSSK